MSRKQKRMGPVGCFGQIENIKRQSLGRTNGINHGKCTPSVLYGQQWMG